MPLSQSEASTIQDKETAGDLSVFGIGPKEMVQSTIPLTVGGCRHMKYVQGYMACVHHISSMADFYRMNEISREEL
jgi:hypothetical protein